MEPASVDQLLSAERFLVPPPGELRIAHTAGRWAVFLEHSSYPSDRALIEIAASNHFTVTRNIAMRGGGWMNEHVGAAPLERPDLLQKCIGFALTGTSRLGITSIETPHPAYALGLIAYPHDRAGELEAKLRAGLPIDDPGDDFPILFNRLALSPWTNLADNLIAAVLRFDGAAERLGFMLRHLARHLNAFDLVRFHNRGANYPDALMLDAALAALIGLLRGDEDRMLRRALRQGWLARKRCEGLLVPDRPTSPGDNARAMPTFEAVPDAQFSDPRTRSRKLFHDRSADDMLTPIARELLTKSIADLQHEDEVRELGTALFLDRPLGAMGKRNGEADRTTLLSYEACSVRMIKTSLAELNAGDVAVSEMGGLPVARMPGHAREGVVALEDAKKVALDFVFRRTTRSRLADLLRDYDLAPLNAAAPDAYCALAGGKVLLIRTSARRMTAFDERMARLFELSLDDSARYVECGGREYVEGLCASVGGEEVLLSPRW